MANLKVYSIFDKEVKEFSASVMVFPTDIHASRALERIVQNEYELKQHPDKFALYCVGSYDSATGLLASNSDPVFVVEVESVVSFLGLKSNKDE